MIVFGVGASTYATECDKLAFSRLTEVTDTTVPAGATTGAADAAGRIPCIRPPASRSPTRIRYRRSRCSTK